MKEIIETEATDVTEATLKKLGGEIVALTRQAQKVALVYICEIGEKLTEAKELVGHGNWGGWLREECNYSQGTAENYIRIFKEFGQKQISFFETDNTKFQNLTYTKLLALTTLTADERERLAGDNDLEAVSVRELQALIDQEKAARASAESEAETLKAKIAEQSDKARANKKKITDLKEQLAAAEKQTSILEANAADVRESVRAELQAKIDDAEKARNLAEDAQRELEDKLKKLEMQQTEELLKAKNEGRKSGEAKAQFIAEEATAELRAELERTKAKLDAAQNGIIHKVQFALDSLVHDIKAIGEMLTEMQKSSPETADKIRPAIIKQIQAEAERI